MLCGGPYVLALARARGGKNKGNLGSPKSQKFSHETGRGLSGVALSVMKYAWDGRLIRIRGAVLHFRDGRSQTKPVIDAMAFITGAYKTQPRLV
jgi:hypothetical protein